MRKISFLLLTLSVISIGCNNNKTESQGSSQAMSTMSSSENKEERNKKVIMASMESFSRGDIDGTFKDAAGSFTDYSDGSMPPITNLDTLKNFIKMVSNSLEGYKGENLKYYADGDYVLVHGDWSATFKHDLMGIKATGKPVKFKDVDIFKLNDDGKISEHSSVQNVGAILMTADKMK
jgi:predicted ester cyclase